MDSSCRDLIFASEFKLRALESRNFASMIKNLWCFCSSLNASEVETCMRWQDPATPSRSYGLWKMLALYLDCKLTICWEAALQVGYILYSSYMFSSTISCYPLINYTTVIETPAKIILRCIVQFTTRLHTVHQSVLKRLVQSGHTNFM